MWLQDWHSPGNCDIDFFIFHHRFCIYETGVSEIQKRPKCCRKILNWQQRNCEFYKIQCKKGQDGDINLQSSIRSIFRILEIPFQIFPTFSDFYYWNNFVIRCLAFWNADSNCHYYISLYWSHAIFRWHLHVRFSCQFVRWKYARILFYSMIHFWGTRQAMGGISCQFLPTGGSIVPR